MSKHHHPKSDNPEPEEELSVDENVIDETPDLPQDTPPPVEESPVDDSPVEEVIEDKKSNQDLQETHAPNDPTTIYFLGIPADKLGELIEKKVEQDGNAFRQEIEQKGSWAHTLYSEWDKTTAEIARASKFLNETLTENPRSLQPFVKDEKGERDIRIKQVTVPGEQILKEGGVIPNTSEGIAYALNIISKPVRRIVLYASGISLEICAPSPQQLTDFMLRTEAGARSEFGYITGFPCYFYMDYGIKVEFMNLLNSIIIDSSLPNWQEKGALESNILLSDLPALMTHVAAIMFPKGYKDFKHFCPRPPDAEHPNGCNHVIEKEINIANLLLNRGDLIRQGDIAHLQKALRPGTKFTIEEIKKYRESIGNMNHTLRVQGQNFNVELALKGITIGEHLESASDMIASMKEAFKDPSEKDLNSFALSRSLNALQAYVQSVKLYDPTNPSVFRGSVVDKKGIERVLGSLASDPSFKTQVVEPIEKFASSLQLTYVGYPKFKCPACGYIPEYPKTFFVMDPQSVFFTAAWKVLRPNTSPENAP